MTAIIRKWGNSHAIRLPKAVMELAFLKESDSVQISVEKEQVIIKKAEQSAAHKQERKTLKQRVEEFYGKDFETVLNEYPYDFQEADSGLPVGEEIW